MAKTGKTGLIGLIAFVAVILVAVAYGLGALESWAKLQMSINGRSIPGILMWVASVFMTIVIIWASFDFAMKQSKGWQIAWWILAILAVLCVLGVGGFNSFNA